MSKTIKVIISFLIMYLIMVSLDLYLSYNHEISYGPYKYDTAEITMKYSFCRREMNNRSAGINDIQLRINNSTYRTSNPYIGLYPMRLCLFKKYIPIYDYNKLSNLKVGDTVKVIISNENKIYLGRTSYTFNITTMLILVFCIMLIIYFNKSFKPTPKSGAV